MENVAKEFKCPYCYVRNSLFFKSKKSHRITCVHCGEEFNAELDQYERVITSRTGKPSKAQK